MIEKDEDLVRRAELWATGATIHDVKTLLGTYYAAIACLNRPPESDEQKVRAEKMAAWSCKTLEEFMSHGDYRRACRENPLP